MKNYLITTGSTSIRCVKVDLQQVDVGYEIHRESWQWKGKVVQHPVISITKGKVKRTVEEQAQLEYSAILKKYRDKGYKDIDVDPDTLTEAEIKNILGDTKTDANGFGKHMLAKPVNQVKSATIEKVALWYASRKIDGVRNSFYFNNNEVKSASRGGGNYDVATEHIRTNPKVIQFFQNHPNVILDGELFVMGKSLQQLSGEARREDGTHEFLLEYWIYDIMEDLPFTDRLKHLQEYSVELNDIPEIHFVEQIPISGPDKEKQAWALHDAWVAEGWEGCVIRDASKPYKNGARGAQMIKFKNYKDSCFLIVGKEGGLREIEDMVFIMQTKDGKQFKAKPFGDLKQKEEYWNNFEEKYKGKIGECKYFYYSDEGVPLQPNMKAVRYDLDESSLS